jgi:hypothetical protein
VRGLLSYLTDREANAPLPEGRVLVASGAFTMKGSYGGSQQGLQGLRRELERLQGKLRRTFEHGIPEVVWLLAAALLGIFVVSREFLQLRLRGTFTQPRYARAIPVLAQAGPWARAEVLAAPSTTPLLSLAELETALSEALQHRLGVSPAASAVSLRAALTTRGLDSASADRLVELLAELRRLGQSLASRRPKRPSSASVKRLHDQGMHLLHALERLGDKA